MKVVLKLFMCIWIILLSFNSCSVDQTILSRAVAEVLPNELVTL